MKHTERRGICPRCADRSGHLYQNAGTKAYLCFKCGFRGRGDLIGVNWVDEAPVESGNSLMLPESGDWIHPVVPGTKAEKYLIQHRVTPLTWQRFGVGVNTGRLVLPVFNGDGKIMLYQTRSLTGKVFRTYGERSFATPKFCSTDPAKPTIIVESIVSALRLSPIFPAVAVLGKTFSMAQAEQLRRMLFRRPVAIWFDAGDGVPEALRLAKELREWCRIGLVFSSNPPGTDPCDVENKDVERAVYRVCPSA